MARLTPQEAAEKYVRRASAATTDYTLGVSKVSVAPGELAAQQVQKAQQNYAAKMADGTWANRTRAVSLQTWKDAATNKGGARYAGGVQAAEGKVAAALQQILPAVDAARAKVRAMPSTTVEQRIQRSVAFQTEMAKFRVK